MPVGSFQGLLLVVMQKHCSTSWSCSTGVRGAGTGQSVQNLHAVVAELV